MSFVTTLPESMTAAASSLQAVESALTAQNMAAAAPTTGVAPAAADEVSLLQATQFSAYGTLYQQISAQAAAMQEMFVHTLRTSADSYDAAEAANSVAAAPSVGSGLSAVSGAAPAADPSFGLAGALSNSGILAAMQAGTIGSAASEFTGLGKGYITAPSGVTSGSIDALLFSQTSPAGAAAAAPAPVSAGVGQATPIGGLSVPPSWAGQAAPAAGAAPVTLANAGWTAPTPHGAPMTAMPAGVPAMASAAGGAGIGGFGRPRYGTKPKVMPRRPGV